MVSPLWLTNRKTLAEHHNGLLEPVTTQRRKAILYSAIAVLGLGLCWKLLVPTDTAGSSIDYRAGISLQ